MIMKHLLLVYVLSVLFCYPIRSQISTEELPYTWRKRDDRAIREAVPEIVMPFLDMHAIQKEDLENEGSNIPVRFGFSHEKILSLSNSGIWETTSDGSRLWRLKIYSPDAISLNLLYDKFWLPKGAKFFIYSEDMKQHIGAFTSQNNKEGNMGFATGFLFTNSIVLEYYEPAEIEERGIISVSQIISGYRYVYDIVNGNQTKHNNTDFTCHNDINCPEGTNWQQEKDAVAYMIMGGYICTGSLLNTTANDNRPVFLSADHCFNTSASTTQWVFYWNYEAPCNGVVNPSPNRSTVGANLLARRGESDFMLLYLIEDPATNPNVTTYYLGWDRTAASFASGVCIHHPKGAQKKISITNNPINSYPNIIYWNGGTTSPPNTHWLVNFTDGTAEGGSSGSPLLNQNRRVIGQLHGGTSGCPPYVEKYYGRFDISWTGGATNNSRLSNWLDPNNTGVTVLDGIDACPTTVNFTHRTVTSCGDINIENVTVKNGAKLTLNAPGEVNIGNNF
jgi:hypothetical protein